MEGSCSFIQVSKCEGGGEVDCQFPRCEEGKFKRKMCVCAGVQRRNYGGGQGGKAAPLES